jgi:DNA-binding Lrp family transcriptional regulator
MLDEKDEKILSQLREDAEMTTKAIAEETGIPRTTVHDRITKMEERGVIEQYTVIPDFTAIGEPATAFVFVAYDTGVDKPQDDLARDIADIDGVYDVHLISGDWDIIVKVRGPDIETIGELVIDRMQELEGVGRTVTSTVFRTVAETV